MKNYIPLFQWVEENFQCSGLCKGETFYYFSDINNGEPKGGCLTEIHDWIMTNFLTIGIVMIIVGTYLVRDI